jgi:hypothetical protein
MSSVVRESRHPSFGGYVNLVMYIAQLQLAGGKYDGTKHKVLRVAVFLELYTCAAF